MKIINESLIRERIVCSAVHCDNGIENNQSIKNIDKGIVTYGRRHHDCFKILFMIPNVEDGKMTCGFLTNQNRFVDREEGYKIAKKENQIWHDTIVEDEVFGTILTSEDLYYCFDEDFKNC